MSQTSSTSRVRTIAEIGLTIALFAVLDYFNVRMPINLAGGSISLSMAPIIVLALFRGPLIGVFAGVLCGGVDLLIAPYAINVFQVILDYPLAYGAVGLAGLVKAPLEKAYLAHKKGKVAGLVVAGVLCSAVGRFVFHFLSGVIFFAENTPAGDSVYVYSALYQLQYLVPSFVGCGIVCAVVVPALLRYFWSE